MPTVALLTCARFADLDPDDQLVLPVLRALGVDPVPVVWDDPQVDWTTFDLAVLRETWDYPERRTEFLARLHHLSARTELLNPVDVVVWNTDKRYLRDLAANGVPIVPTQFIEPGEDADVWTPPADCTDIVVKPAISAGSRDTMRYAADGPLDAARAHIRRLQAEERTVMVQPYLDAVDTDGETALLFIGGELSHAIRKGPLLARDVEGERVEGLFVQEQIDPREATAEQRDVAHRAVAAVPGYERLLYARVDLIAGADGSPRLLELELVEPSLFLAHDPRAAERLAAAIVARLGSRP